jgi:hypothetical protein
MNTLRATSRIPLTLALAGVILVGSPLLAGCSMINSVVHNVTGQDIPDGLTGGQAVPADFPSEVPLIDGDVLLGLSLPGGDSGDAWNVTIKVSGFDAWETIKGQFADAGYEYQEFQVVADKGGSGAFKGDPYSAVVVVSSDKDEWTANYTVTNADTGQ